MRVGCAVAVVVTDDAMVLFGRRASSAGDFEWQLPGGWILPGESPSSAARREVFEETGLQLRKLRYIGLTSNVFATGNHSISICFEAECVDRGALITTERDKCLGWEWKRWTEVDDCLFLPLRLLRQSGYRPFSSNDS